MIFLPDGKKSSFEIEERGKLGMKVIPAGESGVGGEVEESEGDGKEYKEKNGPCMGKKTR